MHRLNPNNPLFINLEMQNPSWWQTLVDDKDIYIEIRKENYIDVYFNGGNIISELKHNGYEFSGKIHYKYLLPEKAEYICYDFSGSNNTITKKSHINLMNVGSFDRDTLKRIKANISNHYPANSEKGIQGEYFESRGFSIHSIHTSGHADIDTLKLMVEAISPKTIVPIHTFNGALYDKIFNHKILLLKDDEIG